MSQKRFHINKITPPRDLSVDIPIIQKLAAGYRLWHANLTNLPRLSRFTLGSKIDLLFYDALELILLAGYSPREKKLSVVERASTKLDALKFFLQIAWEMKVLDTRKYSQLTPPLVEVGKMLGGWRKQLMKNNPPK